MIRPLACMLLLSVVCVPASAAKKALSRAEMVKILQTIDDRMRSPGDYQAQVFLQEKIKGQEDRIFQIVVYRRDKDDNLILLHTKPKSVAGSGYLRIAKNLWHFDPKVGRWERRTEREKIAATAARRRDFDDWDLANEFEPSYQGQEKLGAYTAHKLELRAKPNVDVAFPILNLWIDVATLNPLKMESKALSGRLAVTSYYPKWVKAESRDKKGVVYYPKEIRIFDEIDRKAQTTILVEKATLAPLPPNIFTKAWLESQSR